MTDFTIERYGGLNLMADPQEAGAEQALSLLNVALDRNGRVRTRDGYDSLYTNAALSAATNMHPTATGVLLAAFPDAAVDKIHAINVTTGLSLANTSLTAGNSSFASVGTATYLTDGTTTQIRKWDGAAFSSPAGLAAYEGSFVGVQPLDDRLVIADANSTSKLWFSDPATPETITVTNFLEVTPGDGETITGLGVYGNDLYVFKQSKFFVFYGNSLDGVGEPVFSYRMVDAGRGCYQSSVANDTLVSSHASGLYFVAADGVYRTVGGPPVKVSEAISPVFKGSNLPIPAPFSSVMANPVTRWKNLATVGDRLYLTDGAITFVLDIPSGQWLVHNWPAASHLDGDLIAEPTVDAVGLRGAVILGGDTTSVDAFIARSTDTLADDDGTTITGHHQTGLFDLGSQRSKRIRQLEMWGSGTPTVSVFTDHGSTDANAGTVTLGTAPAVARGWHRKAYRGVLFSQKLSFSGAATVHRTSYQVPDQRSGS